jgi:hypothetical protein
MPKEMTVDMPLVFVALMLTAALLFTLFGMRRELVSDSQEGFVEYIVYGPGWGWGPRWHPRRWWWRRYRPYGPPPGYWYTFW